MNIAETNLANVNDGASNSVSPYQRKDSNVGEETAVASSTEKQIQQTEQTRESISEATEKRLSAQQLEKVAESLQAFVGGLDKSLQFEIHQESGKDVIKVLDGTSGDIIKQYPSEEILDVIANLSKASGLLFNEFA